MTSIVVVTNLLRHCKKYQLSITCRTVIKKQKRRYQPMKIAYLLLSLSVLKQLIGGSHEFTRAERKLVIFPVLGKFLRFFSRNF